jgi:hypothetical protein
MNQGFKQTLLVTMAMAMAAGAMAQVKVYDPGDAIIGDLTNASQSASASNLFRFPDAFDLRDLAVDSTTPADQFKWSYFSNDATITINGVPSMTPGVDDPVNPPSNLRIDQNDLDRNDQDGFDGDPFTVTFRNNNLSPMGGPYIDPVTPGIIDSETRSVSLIASNCTTYTVRTITVYTSNNTSDGLSNDTTGENPPVIDDDLSLASNSGRWAGIVQLGSAAFQANTSGLCLTAPQTGDNVALWISPERFITLVDSSVYRVRSTVTGTQTDVNAVPLWNLGYDNFNSSGAGNNFGGEAWFLDVDGGAQGVGRNGLSNFEVWIAPNAVATKQWQGVVDPANSAFAPAADQANDIRLFFRVNDVGSANIEANSDSGDLCLKSITVTRFPLNQLAVASTAYNTPISTTTHFPEAFSQAGVGGTASIDNGANTANYVLDETAGPARKSLGPWDQTTGGVIDNVTLYPVAWKANTLYRGRLKIRSNAGAEGVNPVEVIALAFDTTNSELGQSHYSTRGSAGNMDLAASPRLAATTGGAQWYTGFFHGQAGTVSVVPNAGRLRLFGDFFSTPSFAGTGNDPFTVEAMEVSEITTPN